MFGRKKKVVPVVTGESYAPKLVEQVLAGDNVILPYDGQKVVVLGTRPAVTQGGWIGSVPATELYLGHDILLLPNGSTIQVRVRQ